MRKQAVGYTATGVVAVVLAAALTLMLNWLGARHWVRGDWTSSRLYSLSEKSLNIVAGLEQDIRVVVFMTPGSPMFSQVRELLDRYTAASERIQVEYVDPDRDLVRAQAVVDELGIAARDTVVFSAGERSKHVTSDNLAEMDYSGMEYGQGPTMKAFTGEEQFTSAILSLVASRVPKVYVVTGHGEASIGEVAAAPERGLRTLGEVLRRENMEVADASLLSGAVPGDADALAIIGPGQPFTEAEIGALAGYLDRGGRLLVCLDPLIDPTAAMRPTRLEGLLAAHGVEVRDDLVVDPERRLPFFDLSAVYLSDFRPHPVTTGLEGVAVLFPVTRSLAVSDAAGANAQVIVETSSGGWGETNLGQLLKGEQVAKDDADAAGPVAVGIVVEPLAQEGAGEGEEPAPTNAGQPPAGSGAGYRLAVFGDSDFLVDSQIDNAGNLTLALNTFNWLVTRDEAVGIPPRDVEQVNLYLTTGQLGLVLFITVIGMPLAAIVLGIAMWFKRRR